MADIITIANTDQRVDHRRYDENFDRAFGEKKVGVTGKYVYRDGKVVPKDEHEKSDKEAPEPLREDRWEKSR
jgi:hypothetical protein